MKEMTNNSVVMFEFLFLFVQKFRKASIIKNSNSNVLFTYHIFTKINDYRNFHPYGHHYFSYWI